jgi:hypothetical protein
MQKSRTLTGSKTEGRVQIYRRNIATFFRHLIFLQGIPPTIETGVETLRRVKLAGWTESPVDN